MTPNTQAAPAPARAPEGMESLLDAVVEVARLTASIALGYFDQARRATLAVEYKTDGSPVTTADRTAELTAREWIERRFPHDGIVGEELGTVRPDARRRWIIDPIDGTKSFVRGVPLWGTLIAVAEGETVLAGAINCAAAGDLVAGAIGQGSWWNGVRCRVSEVSAIQRATVLATDPRESGARPRMRAWRRLSEDAAIARTWGDAYGYVLVATGRAEVMVDAVMAQWDTAALAPVIAEAGGVFTDWGGAVTAFGDGSVATNAALATAVRAVLSANDRPSS